MYKATIDRLAIAIAQLQVTTERITEGGVAADDLTIITAYLRALTEHCYQITSLALRVAENSDADHPIHKIPYGADVQCALSHANALFDAAGHFTADAGKGIRSMYQQNA